MNCQNCSNEMQQIHDMDHFYCCTCQIYEFPTSIEQSPDGIQPAGKTTEFLCPVCPDQSLEIGLIGKCQVCFCNNCRGYVLDTQTLGQLIQALRSTYKGPDDKPVMIEQAELRKSTHCPACFETMQTHPYYGPGNVVLDSCMECKLSWMGHGELAKIVRAPGLRNVSVLGEFKF